MTVFARIPAYVNAESRLRIPTDQRVESITEKDLRRIPSLRRMEISDYVNDGKNLRVNVKGSNYSIMIDMKQNKKSITVQANWEGPHSDHVKYVVNDFYRQYARHSPEVREDE